jgi:hypothetical protein
VDCWGCALGVIEIVAGVNVVRFVDDQGFDPTYLSRASVPAIIVFGNLFGAEVSVVARNAFTEGAKCDIKVVKVPSNRPAAITLGDVPVNGIGRCEHLARDQKRISPRGTVFRGFSHFSSENLAKSRSDEHRTNPFSIAKAAS